LEQCSGCGLHVLTYDPAGEDKRQPGPDMPFCSQIIGIGKTSGPASSAQAVVANEEKRLIGLLERHVGCWLYLVLHTQQDIEQPRCCCGFIRDANASIMEFAHGFGGVEKDTA